MAKNFYQSIDVAFDRFEVKKKLIQPFFLIIHFNLSGITSSNMSFSVQVYVKNNIFKIPASVLLPEDKVSKLCCEVAW